MIPLVNQSGSTTPGTGLTEGQESQLATATRRQPVATIALLKGVTPSAGDVIQVLGHTVAGDGGGGLFRYDSGSSATDDGGLVIAPTEGGGRWFRVRSGTTVNVRWFGLALDGSDETTALQAVVDSVTKIGADSHKKEATLYFPGEQASIKLAPTSGSTAIFSRTCRFVGEGCVIDLSDLTADEVGIDLGDHDYNSIYRWDRGAVVSGFKFIGTGKVAWGIRCAKPFQLFSHLSSTGLKSLFKFAQVSAGAQGPYMCKFNEIISDDDYYGIYWPPDMPISGSTMGFRSCDFARNTVAVYVNHNATGSFSNFGMFNFDDCTFDNCTQYLATVEPAQLPWDRKLQINFVNCWFEAFTGVGETFAIDLKGGGYTFVGCKWVENSAWAAGKQIGAAYAAYVALIGCEFDLAGSSYTPVATDGGGGGASFAAVNCRSREGNKLALTSGIFCNGELRPKTLINVPATIPWGTVTATAALTELGTDKHGVISIGGYNAITLFAYLSDAGPAGAYLGLQIKVGGDWKWLDNVAGDQTTGTSKISVAATGMVSSTIPISQSLLNAGGTCIHEYRFVTHGGDGVDSAILTDLSISLE